MNKNKDEITLKWIIISNGIEKPLEEPIKIHKKFNNQKELESFRAWVLNKAQKEHTERPIKVLFYFNEKGAKINNALKAHLNTIPEPHKKYAEWLKSGIRNI